MTTTIEERAREIAAEIVGTYVTARAPRLSDIELIATAMREVAEECMKATCSGCLNEFLVEAHPYRPDEFWHKEKINDGRFLCRASGIRARFNIGGGDDQT